MSEVYGMRRANGDWFALDDHGRLRVPVFRSSDQAMRARARNSGMLRFRPIVLNEYVLNDLLPTGGESAVYFWLVDKPSENLKRGRPLDHAQLALLIQDSTEQPQGSKPSEVADEYLLP